MAILFSVSNKRVTAGPVLTNQDITPPAGTVAILYTVTVDDPTVDPPTPADFTAWVEYLDGSTWHEVSRFTATCSCESEGRVPVRGSAMRISAVAGMTMRISVLAQTGT